MSENQTNINSWDGILVNYLKAKDLEEQTEKVVCIGVNLVDKELDLEVELKQEKFIFSLNVTNKLFLKEHGIKSPSAIIGKVLTLKKVLATNPTTKKEVESLRISEVE